MRVECGLKGLVDRTRIFGDESRHHVVVRAGIIAGAGHMGRKKGQSNDNVVDIVTTWLREKLA